MLLKTDLIPLCSKARPGILLPQPVKYITIHWIGPYPAQAVEDPRTWWLKGSDGNGLEASAHYILKDDIVLECIPITEVAWHAGCRAGNYSSIGIEVIPSNTVGEFSELSRKTLKELLGELPKVPLKRHYDWTKKNCPLYYTPFATGGEERWEELIKWLTI